MIKLSEKSLAVAGPLDLKIKKCEICGKEISYKHSGINSKHYQSRRFCSQKCMGKSYTKIINRKCPTCGKIFLIIGSHTNSAKYCSDECRSKVLRGYGWSSELHIPTETWKHAYFAAMLDGEGSIKKTRKKGSKNEIEISNNNYELMLWLKENFGGKIGISRLAIGNRKTQYRWRMCRMIDAHDLLRVITPYLIVKKQKAIEMMANIEIRYKKRFIIKEVIKNE